MKSDLALELELELKALKIDTANSLGESSTIDESPTTPTGSDTSELTIVTYLSDISDGVNLPTPTTTDDAGASTPTSTVSALTILTTSSFSDDDILVTPTSSTGSGVHLLTPTSTISDGVIIDTPFVTTDSHSDNNSITTRSTTSSSPKRQDDFRVGAQARYFDGFPGFVPNHQARIRSEFGRLAVFRGWVKGSKVYKTQRLKCFSDEYKRLHNDFHDNKLQVWQALCLEIAGLEEAPASSIKQCKKILKKYHVSIFDYIDAKRAGTPVTPIFTNKSKFIAYIAKKGNLFPIQATKQNPSRGSMLEFLNVY